MLNRYMQGKFSLLSRGKRECRAWRRVPHSQPTNHDGGWQMSVVPSGPNAPGDDGSAAKRVAGEGAQAAGQAAGEVKDTAKEQAQRVGHEAKTQVRNVASDVRGRLSEQARNQNDTLVSSIRRTADQLDEMRGDRTGSPAASVVSRVADGGRQLADYLDRNGPEGVLSEVQDFARRRPGAFLATALAAGFVVGRLGKSVAKADSDAGSSKPSNDSYVSNLPPGSAADDAGRPFAETGYPAAETGYRAEETGYPAADPGYPAAETGYPAADPAYPAPTTASTEYASTGTGTPVVVEEDYVVDPPATGYPGGTR